MSKATPTASNASSSDLQAIFDASLKEYEKKTETSLLKHPLMDKLKACKSSDDTLAVLRSQAAKLEQTTSADEKLIEWVDPIVNVIAASSSVISAGVGMIFSPANVIFAGAGVLISAAKEVNASYNKLIIVFKRIESFFKRLEEYASVPMTEAMKDIMVKIMVEVLDVFANMTAEMKQRRSGRYLKRFFKKLTGKKGSEDALSELDRLTQEEVNMAIAQTRTLAQNTKDGVEAVGKQVNQLIEDNKEREAREEEEKQRKLDEEYRSRVRADRAWLSPPDTSTNQNTASNAQHKGTTRWFFEENIATGWKSKSTSPFLWVHGKPGSGKSVLCSAIIQDIMALQELGQATVAYFYFDFKDTDKQDLGKALPSLLTQLSARSDSYCDILSHVHKSHSNGAYKPSVRTMTNCLKEMLALPDQGPVFIILDALDECPNSSKIPSAREEVLDFLKDLVGLQLSTLHICVTSRPEIDIGAVLDHLMFHSVSIHEQIGQKKDIEDYIRAVVYGNSFTAMKRWRGQEKELVIETLTKRADGMFRWVFCQLEALRRCLPHAIRQTLSELPPSLDETYQRVLNEIGMANRDLAHRLLQCLTMAIRPLRLDELAEILALDFKVTEGELPKLDDGCQSENPQHDVLSTCSSLIMLVDNDGSRVIQFSHFSVKEFLTSERLAAFQGDISSFHISAEPAHITLAQVCLGTLLHLNGDSNLKRYASQHWVEHVRFKTVSSLETGIWRLFDPAEPYFAAWLQLYDIDKPWTGFGVSKPPNRGSPLYYASLCGLLNLATRTIDKHPELVNAVGGCNHSPLVATLYKGHFDVAELLYQHGAAVDVSGYRNQTPLQFSFADGLIDVARWLLQHGADVNVRAADYSTLLHSVISRGRLEYASLLLEHGAGVDAVDRAGWTELHLASSRDDRETAQFLLDRGANANAKSKNGLTPLHLASAKARTAAVRLLLDHRGTDADARDCVGRTSLHLAWTAEVVHLLLDHGADVDAEDMEGRTSLHIASLGGESDIIRLLEGGASADAKNKDWNTPPSHISALTSPTGLRPIFYASLTAYKKRVKVDLITHPLTTQLQTCDSPTSILALLQAQDSEGRLTQFLGPTVNVLLAFSAITGGGVGLFFSPVTVIFAGTGVLLQAIKDVIAEQNAMIDIFERIEYFFKRIDAYTEVRPSEAMTGIIVKIMAEVLNVFALTTKEIRQGQTKRYLKKLMGRTDIEHALQRLDKLTQDLARMATAQLLMFTHGVDDKVTKINDEVKDVGGGIRD